MNILKRLEKYSLEKVALLQALGLALYISSVSIFMWKAGSVIGPTPSFLGPFLFLALFVTSALICALITFGFPFYLFWEKKRPIDAIKVVAIQTGWMFVLVLVVLTLILLHPLG